MSQQQIQAVMGQLAVHFQSNYPQQWASMNPQQQQVYVYNMALQQLGQAPAPVQPQQQVQQHAQQPRIPQQQKEQQQTHYQHTQQQHTQPSATFSGTLGASRQASVSSQGYGASDADHNTALQPHEGALAANELNDPALMTEKEKLEMVKTRMAEQQSQKARLLQETKDRMKQNAQLQPKANPLDNIFGAKSNGGENFLGGINMSNQSVHHRISQSQQQGNLQQNQSQPSQQQYYPQPMQQQHQPSSTQSKHQAQQQQQFAQNETPQYVPPQAGASQKIQNNDEFDGWGFDEVSSSTSTKAAAVEPGVTTTEDQEWAEFGISTSTTTASPQQIVVAQQQQQCQQQQQQQNLMGPTSDTTPTGPKGQVDLLLEKSLNLGSAADKRDPKQGFQKVEINRRIGGYKEIHQPSVKSANWGNLTADMSDMFKDEETLKRERAEAEAAALAAKEEALQKALQAQFAAQKLAEEQQQAAALLHQQQMASAEQEKLRMSRKDSGARNLDYADADGFGEFEGENGSYRRGSQGNRQISIEKPGEGRKSTREAERKSSRNYSEKERYGNDEVARHRRDDIDESAQRKRPEHRSGRTDEDERNDRHRRGGRDADARVRDKRDHGDDSHGRYRKNTDRSDRFVRPRDDQRSSEVNRGNRSPIPDRQHKKEIHRDATPQLNIHMHMENETHMPPPPQLHLQSVAVKGIDRVTSPDLPVHLADAKDTPSSRDVRRKTRLTPTERARARRAEQERTKRRNPKAQEREKQGVDSLPSLPNTGERSRIATTTANLDGKVMSEREARQQADREALDGSPSARHSGAKSEGGRRDFHERHQSQHKRSDHRAHGEMSVLSTSNDVTTANLYANNQSSSRSMSERNKESESIDWTMSKAATMDSKPDAEDDAFGDFESETAGDADQTNYFKDEGKQDSPVMNPFPSLSDDHRRRKSSGSYSRTAVKGTVSQSSPTAVHTAPRDSIPRDVDAKPDLDMWTTTTPAAEDNALDLGFGPADDVDDDGDDYGYSFGGSFGAGLVGTIDDKYQTESVPDNQISKVSPEVADSSFYATQTLRNEPDAEEGRKGEKKSSESNFMQTGSPDLEDSPVILNRNLAGTATATAPAQSHDISTDLFASFTNANEDANIEEDDFGDFGGFNTNFEEDLAPGMGIAMAFSTQAYSHDPTAPDHDGHTKSEPQIETKSNDGRENGELASLNSEENVHTADTEQTISDTHSQSSTPGVEEKNRDTNEGHEDIPVVIRKYSEDSPAYVKAREFAEHATGSVNYDDALSTFMTDLDTLVAEKKATEHESQMDENKNESTTVGRMRKPSVVPPSMDAQRTATPPPTDGDLYSYFRGASETEAASDLNNDCESLPATVDDIESEWAKLLTRCMAVLTTAQRTLDRMQHTASKVTIEEVMAAPNTRGYLIGIAEIYLLSRRIQAGVKEDMVGCCRLLEDVDHVWQGLIPHVEGVCLKQVNAVKYEGSATEIVSPQDDRNSPLNGEEVSYCGICLYKAETTDASNSDNAEQIDTTKVSVQSEGEDDDERQTGEYQPNTAVAHINDVYYHVTCANFWIREVTHSIPNLTCR